MAEASLLSLLSAFCYPCAKRQSPMSAKFLLITDY